MRYQASWRHAKVFWGLVAGISLLLLLAGALFVEPVLCGLGIALLTILFGMKYRLAVEMDEEWLRCQNWLARHEVRWRDVRAVIRGWDLPYPRDRWVGGGTYEVRTEHGRFLLNPLYFSAEFNRAFSAEIKTRKLLRRGKRAV